jgi:hypothetical protein
MNYPTPDESFARLPAGAVAEIQFTDGTARSVFEDTRGQYVLDDDGEPVYGVWFIPREECDVPVIVNAGG